MPRGKKNNDSTPASSKKTSKNNLIEKVIEEVPINTSIDLENDNSRSLSESNVIKECVENIIESSIMQSEEKVYENSQTNSETEEIIETPIIVNEDLIVETPIIIHSDDKIESMLIKEEEIIETPILTEDLIIETPIITEEIIANNIKNLEELNNQIDQNSQKEITNIIEELKEESSNILDKKFVLQESTIKNILGEEQLIFNDFLSNSTLNSSKKYSLSDLKKIFFNFSNSLILVQIIEKKIKFIEKKNLTDHGYNKDSMDIIYRLNNEFELPNMQFLVTTKKILSANEKNIKETNPVFLYYTDLLENNIIETLKTIYENCVINNDFLDQSIFYSTNKIVFKNKISEIDNSIIFNYKENDLQINFCYNDDSKLKINIYDNNTTIYYNDLEVFKKYTPMILNNSKSQNYKISILDNTFNLIVEGKFNLVKADLKSIISNFLIEDVEIMSMEGGWWVV